jgi:hypothetical protein
MLTRTPAVKADLSFSPDPETRLRHRCRNLRCRCKLPIPTDNPRNAFCCRGCFNSYFRSLCLVCERPFKRVREDQHTCGKPKCKAALARDRAHFFAKWGQIPETLQSGVGNPANTGLKTAHESGRPWRQTAGAPMTAEAVRLVTVGSEAVVQLERKQRAIIEAYLHTPDPDRAAAREAEYVALVRRLRDHGYGKPVAAPATRSGASCDWTPSPNIDPSDVPPVPASLRREAVQ